MTNRFGYSFLAMLVGFAFIMSLPSCKKDKDIDINQILGRYVIVSGGYTAAKYLEITSDTMYFMEESGNYGKRGLEAVPFTFTEENIDFWSTLRSYSYNDGEIAIDSLYGSNTFIAVKNSNVPATSQWVHTTTVTDLGPLPGVIGNPIGDMTSFYGNVVTDGVDNGTEYVFKNLTISGSSITANEIPIEPFYTSEVGYANNIEFMGNKFLVYSWGSPSNFYSIDPFTGNVIIAIPVNNDPGYIYAIAFDGSNLYGMSYDGILKFDFVNDEWGNEIRVGGAGTLAGKDGYLYLTNQSENIIQKYDPLQHKVVGAYSIPQYYSLNGMAFLGNNILASAYDYNTGNYTIIRIVL